MNDWYERGEFPPVGTKCEYRKNSDEWLVGEIFGHRSDSQGNISAYVNLNGGKNWDYSSQVDKFRPLHTETDKLVDDVIGVLKSVSEAHSTDLATRLNAEAVVNAGYRKIKPMSEDEFSNISWIKCGLGPDTAKKLWGAGCRFLDREQK